ncbi:MAG: response regulator [Chitinivibrionales bacterium]|nr:response regulator [Chitinivibrionales bacterium]
MNILVADDSTIARDVLTSFVTSWGHTPTIAADGNEALAALLSHNIQLALIDWVMPNCDGISLCKKIRSDTTKPYIYIILITSKDRKQDILAGLEAGADDYIAKPVFKEELKIKLTNGHRILTLQEKLRCENLKVEQYARQMEQLAEARAQQLLHAERMATLGVLSAGIAHEVNNPNSFIMGNIQIVQQWWNFIQRACTAYTPASDDEKKKMEHIVHEMPKIFSAIKTGAQRVSKIVSGLKAFSRQEKARKEPTNLRRCVDDALELCANTLKQHMTVVNTVPMDLPLIMADAQQIVQVLVNLFVNAADATEDTPNATLTISASCGNSHLTIEVQDNGPGIETENLDKIWQPFFTTKPTNKGTGLGLSICHGIIEGHNGLISVKSGAEVEAGGACFTMSLPIG